jgi:hypothetical protein
MNFFLDMMPREICNDGLSQDEYGNTDLKRVTSAGTLLGTKTSPSGPLNNPYQLDSS